MQQSFLPQLAERETDRRALVRGALAATPHQARVRRDLERLLLYIAATSREHSCRAYHRTMAAQLALPDRTLRRQLALLRDLGWLSIRPSFDRQGGGRSSNSYELDWAAIRRAGSVSARRNSVASGKVASGQPGTTSACGLAADLQPPASSLQPPQTGQAPGQTGQAPGQTGQAPLRGISGSLSGSLKIPPPEPSAFHLPPSALPQASACGLAPPASSLKPPASWSQVEEEFLNLGLGKVASAIAAARKRALGPGDALALVAVAKSNASRWTSPAGALYLRLQFFRPGDDPADLSRWPQPSPHFDLARQSAAQAKAREERQRHEASARTQRQRERDQAATLERELGPTLDALDEAERHTLAERLLAPIDLASYAHGQWREEYHPVRVQLLAALASSSFQCQLI